MYQPEKVQGMIFGCSNSLIYLTNSILFTAQDGRFGAMMDVTLTNEVLLEIQNFGILRTHVPKCQGPVTFTIDSRKFEYVNANKGHSLTPTPKVPNEIAADSLLDKERLT